MMISNVMAISHEIEGFIKNTPLKPGTACCQKAGLMKRKEMDAIVQNCC